MSGDSPLNTRGLSPIVGTGRALRLVLETMRASLAIVVLLAAGCHGGRSAAPSSGHAHPRCLPVSFTRAPGWRTRSTMSGGLRIAEATTARFHERASEFPDATLRSLPRDGILVTASDYGREARRNLGRRRRPPYRLVEFRHDRGWEGQPDVNVPQYVLFTSLRHHALDVRVFFGTQTPSHRLADRAEAELASLRWGFCR